MENCLLLRAFSSNQTTLQAFDLGYSLLEKCCDDETVSYYLLSSCRTRTFLPMQEYALMTVHLYTLSCKFYPGKKCELVEF